MNIKETNDITIKDSTTFEYSLLPSVLRYNFIENTNNISVSKILSPYKR